MNSGELQKAIEIFDIASELPTGNRAEYLRVACEGMPELRSEVERLLRSIARADAEDFLLTSIFAETEIESGKMIGRGIGPYRLVAEVGSGGMGVVYRAVRTDDVYRKDVALKLLWPSMQRSSLIKRFKQEREILSRLDHPNIARLLDGGTTDEGAPYLVMEFVDGLPITEYCDRERLNITERLMMFRSVCEAMHYAHKNLVVHRDLKPGNIFVTPGNESEGPCVKLLDFGIAKLLKSESPDEELTRTGLFLLTPHYASPEQIRGESISTATDIYSLGVVLFELLTGHRPYRGRHATPALLTRAILEETPELPSAAVARPLLEIGPDGQTAVKFTPEQLSKFRESDPDRLRKRLRGDLDNILKRALQKDPADRYVSAAQFAEDLDHHLKGRPVLAREATLGYRMERLVRRHKLASAGTGIAIVLFITLFIQLVQFRNQALIDAELNRRRTYTLEMNQALAEIAGPVMSANLPRMQELLDHWLPGADSKVDLRGFEWYYLWRSLHRERKAFPFIRDSEILHSFFLSERSVLFYNNQNSSIPWKMLDIESGKIELIETPAYKSCQGIGRYGQAAYAVLIEDDHTLKIVKVYPLEIYATLRSPASAITSVKLVNLSQIFTGHADGSIKLWDMPSGNLKATLKETGPAVITIIEDEDRTRLWAQLAGNQVELWDLVSGRLLWRQAKLGILAFCNSELTVIYSQDRKAIQVHDTRTGIYLRSLESPSVLTSHIDRSPDGKIFYSQRQAPIIPVWEASTGRKISTLKGHADWVEDSRLLSPSRLLTISQDQTIRTWDLNSYEEVSITRGLTEDLITWTLPSSGQILLTLTEDNIAKVWEVSELLKPDILRGHDGYVYAAAVSPDGTRVATAGRDGTVRLWDADKGLRQVLRGHSHEVLSVAFAPDGKTIVSGSKDRTAKVWDAETGACLHTITGHANWVRTVAYSNDGRRLATGSEDKTIKIWDVQSRTEIATLQGHEREVLSVAFSPDGTRLVSGSWDATARVWDLASNRELFAFRGHPLAVWSAKYSPDGTQIATGSRDKTIKLWDANTGRELRTMKGHRNEIFSIAFTPDGKRIASASNDFTIKLWNTETGEETLTLRNHMDQVWSVAFSADGKTMVSGSWDGTARLYRTAKEEEVQARMSPSTGKQ
jgi:WD40 repeat protein